MQVCASAHDVPSSAPCWGPEQGKELRDVNVIQVNYTNTHRDSVLLPSG